MYPSINQPNEGPEPSAIKKVVSTNQRDKYNSFYYLIEICVKFRDCVGLWYAQDVRKNSSDVFSIRIKRLD